MWRSFPFGVADIHRLEAGGAPGVKVGARDGSGA